MAAILRSIGRLGKAAFPGLRDRLARELEGCESVLDLGCGRSSFLRYCRVPYSVGVELHEPYIRESERTGIHSEYILADVRTTVFKQGSFDCVLAMDVLEHLSRDEGFGLIEAMEGLARKKTIIVTPNGFLRQGEYDKNPLQTHRSGWTVDDLRRLGYRVKGMRGWRPLRKEESQFRVKPKIVAKLLTSLTLAVTHHCPKSAFQLLAVKSIVSNRGGE